MHAEAAPTRVEATAGDAAVIRVAITNTSTLIDAYRVRIFGLDPDWVALEPARLSLFPNDVETVTVTVTLPPSFPAGARQVAIHVQSENDPSEFTITPVTIVVADRPRVGLRVEPVTVTGGGQAAFSLLLANEGNTTLEAVPNGVDPEATAAFAFSPSAVQLPPGGRDVILAQVRGGRPWFGQPRARVLTFSVGDGEPVEAIATFIQRPRIGRGLISLMGLVLAAAVFATVLSRAFEGVVDEASVDGDVLASALDDDSEDGAATVPLDPGAVAGKVVVATSGAGIAGVQAELFSAGDPNVALASAATADDGSYAFGRLGAGTYRVRFTGAGFTGLWFPDATAFADGTDVEVELGQAVALPDVVLGGRPGSVAGKVMADEIDGATATLIATSAIDTDVDATVTDVDVSADGSFAFEEVPSPARYQLVIEMPGFATQTRDVVVGPAQTLEDIEVVMTEGDGSIRGRVQAPGGPLGGVTVEASDGTTTISTVSLTEGDVGTFALRGLPTPGQYTLSVRRDGYSSESRTVTLEQSQQLAEVVATLTLAEGSLAGTVNLAGSGPVGGVKVSVTGAGVDVATTSASQGEPGSYVVEELPVPGTYTVTFTRDDLVTQVRQVDLDPVDGTSDRNGVDATMVPRKARVRGVVRGVDGSPVPMATVMLTDGTNTFALDTAHDPLGRFEFGDVVPGTYTLSASLPGTSPVVVLVNVVAAEAAERELRLEEQASLTGQVLVLDPATGQFVPFAGAIVGLFDPDDFPGAPPDALILTETGADGRYQFANLSAPDDFVVAVYQGTDAAEPLDSELVQTQPSDQVEVPTFQIREVF